jgi:hypothetical protein
MQASRHIGAVLEHGRKLPNEEIFILVANALLKVKYIMFTGQQ